MNSPMHNTQSTMTDEHKDDKRWSIRALIVDDDVPIRELMIDYLARFNIHASGVTDGAAMRQALLAEHLASDPVPTQIYGFTRLGLFELTRARRGPTLAAQLEALEKSDA